MRIVSFSSAAAPLQTFLARASSCVTSLFLRSVEKQTVPSDRNFSATPLEPSDSSRKWRAAAALVGSAALAAVFYAYSDERDEGETESFLASSLALGLRSVPAVVGASILELTGLIAEKPFVWSEQADTIFSGDGFLRFSLDGEPEGMGLTETYSGIQGSTPTSGRATDLACQDDICALPDTLSNNVYFMDIGGDPLSPSPLGSVPALGSLGDLAPLGSGEWLAGVGSGLKLFNRTDILGSETTPGIQPKELYCFPDRMCVGTSNFNMLSINATGTVPSILQTFPVSGVPVSLDCNFPYCVAVGSNSVQVFDVSNSTGLTVADSTTLGSNLFHVDCSWNTATCYVGGLTGFVHSIQIDGGGLITVKETLPTPCNPESIWAASDGLTTLLSCPSGLQVVSANPPGDNLALGGFLATPSNALTLEKITPDYWGLANWVAGFTVLDFSSTLRLDWTPEPEVSGPQVWDLVVANSDGSATVEMRADVLPAITPEASIAAQEATKGKYFSLELPGPLFDHWNGSVLNIEMLAYPPEINDPRWVAFDPETSEVFGTPQNTGSGELRFTATDSLGATASLNVPLEIKSDSAADLVQVARYGSLTLGVLGAPLAILRWYPKLWNWFCCCLHRKKKRVIAEGLEFVHVFKEKKELTDLKTTNKQEGAKGKEPAQSSVEGALPVVHMEEVAKPSTGDGSDSLSPAKNSSPTSQSKVLSSLDGNSSSETAKDHSSSRSLGKLPGKHNVRVRIVGAKRNWLFFKPPGKPLLNGATLPVGWSYDRNAQKLRSNGPLPAGKYYFDVRDDKKKRILESGIVEVSPNAGYPSAAAFTKQPKPSVTEEANGGVDGASVEVETVNAVFEEAPVEE